MNNNLNYHQSLSQTKQILAWLQSGNTITAIEALEKFGCFRLASRINDLKNGGYIINRRSIIKNGKRVAQYYIADASEIEDVIFEN